jgi:tetratricopeptide (TPR) repeat protein
VVLAWRIGALGVAQIYGERLDQDGAAAARQMLNWHGGEPEALYRLGSALTAADPETARALLAEAYRLNPTRAWPLLMLGKLAASQGEMTRAEPLVEMAATLAPVSPSVQEAVAAFWAEQGRLDRAFIHWSRAIQAGSPQTPRLFAVFRELLKTPEGLAAFAEIARRPPQWFEPFFIQTAEGQTDVRIVKAVYDMRRVAGGVPLSSQERMAYVARLLREEDFEGAYLAWINSLLPGQRQQLGLLYNGGFELPFTGSGFDWHVVKHERVSIARAPVEDGQGQSLRIVFGFSRTRFDHFYQPLYLSAGAYRVSGRYRSDKLYSESGLRWMAQCRATRSAKGSEPSALGESQRILGSEDWTNFSFEFEVPESCVYQQLRLASADTQRLDEATDGTLWFDDLQIVRIAELSPLERARAAARQAAGGETTRGE